MINPATAAKYGVGDGDEVVVESPYGQAHTTAELTTRMHPEVVGMQHGFGHWALGKAAAGRGGVISDLNTIRYCPVTGNGLHKEICVRVYEA
jgi:anaerobic selenocysteine-containing dehydrogenase